MGDVIHMVGTFLRKVKQSPALNDSLSNEFTIDDVDEDDVTNWMSKYLIYCKKNNEKHMHPDVVKLCVAKTKKDIKENK